MTVHLTPSKFHSFLAVYLGDSGEGGYGPRCGSGGSGDQAGAVVRLHHGSHLTQRGKYLFGCGQQAGMPATAVKAAAARIATAARTLAAARTPSAARNQQLQDASSSK